MGLMAVVGLIGAFIGALLVGPLQLTPEQQLHPEFTLDDEFRHLGKRAVGFVIGGFSGSVIGAVAALTFDLVRLRKK